MQVGNNFSSSVIFNINYLVEPNNCINTHTFCSSKSLCKGSSSARELSVFLSICKELSKLFADAFCVIRKSINYQLL